MIKEKMSHIYFTEGISEDEPPWTQKWDTTEMENYLSKGLCDKVETTERIGIHPYWLRNIVVGAMEELREHLGKWSKELKGYLLGFERPILITSEEGKQGDFPHPYIYYMFKLVRYIYRPANGQMLQGTITNFGVNAASCVVFQTFMATVHPKTTQEFNSWNIEDIINFKVERFDQLRKGVVLEGKSIDIEDENQQQQEPLKTKKSKKKHQESINISLLEESQVQEPSTGEQMDYEEEEEPEPPKKKRKKSVKLSKTVELEV